MHMKDKAYLFFLVIKLYSWGSKRYQLLKSNIYKRRYACKKINMIFTYKFIILLSAFRIKLLKNKRKHKKRRKWKNGHWWCKKKKEKKEKKRKLHNYYGENGKMPLSKKKKKIQYFAYFFKLIRKMLIFWNSIFSKSSYKKKFFWSPIVAFCNSISIKSSYMQFFFFFFNL